MLSQGCGKINLFVGCVIQKLMSLGIHDWTNLCLPHLPVSNVTPHAEHKLLHYSVKDVGQGEERQEAVIRAHPDVPEVHKALKGGHSSHQSVVSQHNTLGVTCTTTQDKEHTTAQAGSRLPEYKPIGLVGRKYRDTIAVYTHCLQHQCVSQHDSVKLLAQ